MQVSETDWSVAENAIAQAAFERAYARETQALMETVRQQAGHVTSLEDVWRLHDFLSARRHEIDGKYDNRSSALVFVLAQLVQQNWLDLSELEGLDQAKLRKVTALARM